jgi:hypothetical protein
VAFIYGHVSGIKWGNALVEMRDLTNLIIAKHRNPATHDLIETGKLNTYSSRCDMVYHKLFCISVAMIYYVAEETKCSSKQRKMGSKNLRKWRKGVACSIGQGERWEFDFHVRLGTETKLNDIASPDTAERRTEGP